MRTTMAAARAANIEKQIAALRGMTLTDLCETCHEVFGEETRSRQKDLLRKRTAWRLQANEESDLSERAKRRAAGLPAPPGHGPRRGLRVRGPGPLTLTGVRPALGFEHRLRGEETISGRIRRREFEVLREVRAELTATPVDGTFVFRYLPPGDYAITGIVEARPAPTPATRTSSSASASPPDPAVRASGRTPAAPRDAEADPHHPVEEMRLPPGVVAPREIAGRGPGAPPRPGVREQLRSRPHRLVHSGERREPPPEAVTERRALERALAVIRWPGVRGRTSRLAAYGEWARAMRDDGAFAVDPCRPADILMVVGDAVTMPWEGRWTAAARASTSSARPNWSSAGMAGKPTVGDVTDAEPHLAWLREQNRFSRIGPTA